MRAVVRRKKDTSDHSPQKPLYESKGKGIFSRGALKEAIEKGLILKTGKGLYAYRGVVNDLMSGLDRAFKELFCGFNPQETVYPSTVERQVLEKAGYLENFPDTLELVSCLGPRPGRGTLKQPGKSSCYLTERVLLPAACLPCYAQLSHRRLKDGELLAITVRNKVFRNEPSFNTLFKMNEFEQREVIFIGGRDKVKAALDESFRLVKSLALKLGLKFELVPSYDVFYGKNRDWKSLFQLLTETKIELRAYCPDLKRFIPVTSLNSHGTHFCRGFGVRLDNGRAHSGCVAFGIARWALIVLNTHGLNPAKWPGIIRR